MKRAMSVWLPTFSIDLMRRADRRRADAPPDHSDQRPMLLVATERQRRVVMRCCERAARFGVRRGMPLGEARALFPTMDLRIEEHRPERDEAALRALAAWASRYSPIVSHDPPDGLLLDVSGCAPTFGGERRLLRRVVNDLARLQLGARAVIAPTFGCAWAVARWMDHRAGVIADGEQRRAVAGLPARALRIDEATVDELLEVGVERIEQLLEIPRASIPARFGSDLLLRLDQTLGEAIEVIRPVRSSGAPSASFTFDGPTTRQEAIELIVRRLLEELEGRLASLESGARRIDLELERVDAPAIHLDVQVSRPARDAKRLWTLLRPRVEKVNLGFGVEAIHIRAARLGRLRHEQRSRWRGEEHRHDAELAELVDAMVNRLGGDSVLRMESLDTHIPERAFRARPALHEPRRRRGEPAAEGAVVDRPTVLLQSPVEASVMALTPDGPALSVAFDGNEYRIISSIGPERLSAEWWRRREPTRDYFKLQQEDGRWLWAYRELETAKWFVHGWWA
ncbi:MAG: DNA polymerase Y family protein [Planctomycetota bacterium]|nr:DNA polymerase Y family protein [Planctomycetota bacterium]